MHKVFFLICLFLISTAMVAQGETPKKSGVLKLENYKVPTIEEMPENLPKATIGYESIFSKKSDTYLKKFSFKKDEKVQPLMTQDDTGYDFDEDRKNALNNKLKEATTGNQKTQYLGEFEVKTNLVKVMCRDHQEPDGDVVSIIVNDEVVVQSIVLEGAFKVFYLNLAGGRNRIDFMALNQGTSGPNTAAFVVFDEYGKMVTSSEWNLNTGVKASLIIMNKSATEEKKPEEETTSEDKKQE